MLLAVALLLLTSLHVEGLIHQFLLAAHHFAELVHLLAERVLLALLLVGLGHLQVVHHVLQLAQQFPRLILRAGFRKILDLLHQSVQVLLAQGLGIFRHLHGLVLVLLHALGQFAHELVHGGAQFFHQPLDLFIRRAALQCIGQPLLRFAQPPLSLRQIAILYRKGDFPQQIKPLAKSVVSLGAADVAIGDTQGRVVGKIADQHLRMGACNDVQHGGDGARLLRIHGQPAPFKHQRLGKRLGEDAARQSEGLLRAFGALARMVGCREAQAHHGACPGVGGKIARRFDR